MNLGRHIRTSLRTLPLFAWWLICLFGSAGQLTWKRGWFATVLYLGGTYASRVVVSKLNPGLLEQRRIAIRKDTRAYDRILLRLILFLTMLQPFIAGLDAVRFAWAPMPFWTLYPGVGLFIISANLITWVLVKNPHADSSVRIENDRNHTVIASGPYRFVRHPMYVGLILLHTSMALILGSMWTLVVAALVTILFLWRTALEDQTLHRELAGYEEYATMTRYRLMPGIW
jgi:protein-S-isoprenylcysteine O-methyltransferase Ste14